MKRLTTLIAPLLGVLLLAAIAASVAIAAPAAKTTPTPDSEEPEPYRVYVACGLSKNAKPTHTCPADREKGAFFRSNLADVKYTVCVKFPGKRQLCASSQPATRGRLYVNEITSSIPGTHKVTWFVKGKQVGVFEFVVADGGSKHRSGE